MGEKKRKKEKGIQREREEIKDIKRRKKKNQYS